MGVNERKYAWMDEGWAVELTYDIDAALCPDSVATSPRIAAARYSETAGSEFDMPLLVPSVELTGSAYRRASYDRPAVAYALLREYLGEEVFGKALRQYIERWNGKHPLPYDFFFTFNEVAGEDLWWFWRPWFHDFGFPDLSLKDVHSEGDSTLIVVEKTGTMPVPIALTVTYENGTKETLRRSMGVWKSGETTVKFKTRGKPVKVDLGGEDIPDANKENNTWPNASRR
jgi:aminopeptidase N